MYLSRQPGIQYSIEYGEGDKWKRIVLYVSRTLSYEGTAPPTGSA